MHHIASILLSGSGIVVGLLGAWCLWKLRKEDLLFIGVAFGFSALMLALLGLAVVSAGGW